MTEHIPYSAAYEDPFFEPNYPFEPTAGLTNPDQQGLYSYGPRRHYKLR